MKNDDEVTIGIIERENKDNLPMPEKMESAVGEMFPLMKEILEENGGFNPFLTICYQTNSGREILTTVLKQNTKKENFMKEVLVFGAIIGGWYSNKKFKTFNFVVSCIHGSGMQTGEDNLEKAKKEFESSKNAGKLSDFLISTAVTENGDGYTKIKEIKKKIGSNGTDMVMLNELVDFEELSFTKEKKGGGMEDGIIEKFYEGFEKGYKAKINVSEEENPFKGLNIIE